MSIRGNFESEWNWNWLDGKVRRKKSGDNDFRAGDNDVLAEITYSTYWKVY